jgi:hypothetical protein
MTCVVESEEQDIRVLIAGSSDMSCRRDTLCSIGAATGHGLSAPIDRGKTITILSYVFQACLTPVVLLEHARAMQFGTQISHDQHLQTERSRRQCNLNSFRSNKRDFAAVRMVVYMYDRLPATVLCEGVSHSPAPTRAAAMLLGDRLAKRGSIPFRNAFLGPAQRR